MAPNETTPSASSETGDEPTLFGGEDTPTTPYAAEPAPSAPDDSAAPAPRTRARRTAKKAAAAPPDSTAAPANDTPDEARTGRTADAEQGDAAPARPARKRAPRKSAVNKAASTEPVTEPVTQPVTETLTESVTQPVTEPLIESPAEEPGEPVTEPAARSRRGTARTTKRAATKKATASTTAPPRRRATRRAAAETSDALESVAATEAAAEIEAAAQLTDEPTPEATDAPDLRADQRPTSEAAAAVAELAATVGARRGVEDLEIGEQAVEDAEADEEQPKPVVPSFSLLFQAPDPDAALATPSRRRRRAEAPATTAAPAAAVPVSGSRGGSSTTVESVGEATGEDLEDLEAGPDEGEPVAEDEETPRRSRRRRGGKGRRGRGPADTDEAESDSPEAEAPHAEQDEEALDESATAGEAEEELGEDEGVSSRRRRRRRRAGSGTAEAGDELPGVSTRVRQPRPLSDEPTGVKGSTRLEAKKQRRREGREAGRRRTVITEAEFLARREAVDRVMVVRNKDGRTQMGVLEDGVLVEHYIDQATSVSMAGNIYLGRVQNVLPSMEAAFVDIGKGRNAVLYAGEVNWDAAGLDANQPKRIENALSSGQTVLVQVTKDPIGHKGARLTSQVSLPGRYLVYVPNSSMTGISRKLPDTERARLKKILREVVPDTAGVIVRTAAEGASEEELRADVERLSRTWEDIQAQAEAAASPKAGKSKGKKKNGGSGSSTTGNAPLLLHGEPDLTVRVIRDVFNEDFKQLVVSGDQAWEEIHPYITSVAPDLAERVTKWTAEEDLFTHHRVDEQLAKAMDRKVWLPSGGSLVIDRTEAMTVVDVNTGKFVGSGGNLEETVTKNNLEAAEEIVRQLRLRDIGGIIVIDFIDMVLESNRDLVVRRLLECLGRDRTKHQVAEVTSLGLVQMTRKRVGSGLIEVFSETCAHCNGRGFIIHTEPVDKGSSTTNDADQGGARSSRRTRRGSVQGGTGGNSGSGGNGLGQVAQPEPAKPAGPTAAQIAAAAHAAALKSVAVLPEAADAAAEGVPQAFPEDTGPWQGQDEPVIGQHSATDAVEIELESDVDDPARSASGPAPAEAMTEPAPAEAVTEPAPAQAATEPAVTEPAPRGRRRRGRVVAPAGPPRTTSTQP